MPHHPPSKDGINSLHTETNHWIIIWLSSTMLNMQPRNIMTMCVQSSSERQRIKSRVCYYRINLSNFHQYIRHWSELQGQPVRQHFNRRNSDDFNPINFASILHTSQARRCHPYSMAALHQSFCSLMHIILHTAPVRKKIRRKNNDFHFLRAFSLTNLVIS